MFKKRESLSVFDFCFFSYLSVLMEKYWLRPWKVFLMLWTPSDHDRTVKAFCSFWLLQSYRTQTYKMGNQTINHTVNLFTSIRGIGLPRSFEPEAHVWKYDNKNTKLLKIHYISTKMILKDQSYTFRIPLN